MIDKIIQKIGSVCSWLSFALVILITIDVFLRYIFNFSSASLYELEWHFFAIIFSFITSISDSTALGSVPYLSIKLLAN